MNISRTVILAIKKVVIFLGFPEDLCRIILFELRLFIVRSLWAFIPKNCSTLKRINEMTDVKINFGCGNMPFEGWINVDGIFNPKANLVIDLRRLLPFQTGNVLYIFSEHCIEHFRYDEAMSFLSECFRVLKKGGRIRLIAPDLESMARAYVKRDERWFEKAFPYLDDPVDALNLIFHQGGAHYYIYDSKALQKILKKAGFKYVISSSFRGSACPELNMDCDDPLRTIKSVYVEAFK